MADDRRQQLADDVAAALHRALCSSCYPAARTGFLFASADADKAADALLPLFDRVAADAAAEALEQAAVDYGPRPSHSSWIHAPWLRRELRARAAAHRTPAPSSEENARE